MATHYFASHRGGVEIVAGELFREFVRKGHEVTWIAGDSSLAPEAFGNARTVCLRVFNFVERTIGVPFPVPSLRAIKTICREVRTTELLLLHDCLYLSNIVAFLAARRGRVPILIVQHIGFVPYKNSLLNTLMKLANVIITRPLLSRADQVIFISAATRNFFRSTRFKREPKTIFNGVNTEIYRPLGPPENVADLRNAHHLPNDQSVILFVGRFVEKKGLSALRVMASMRRGYTWAFAGWGPLDPGTWNLPNVRVFRGLQDGALADLYRACDIFVLPSTGEGFPLVIQEALASGLPVVSSARNLDADPRIKEFAHEVTTVADDDQRTADQFLAKIDEALRERAGRDNKSAQRRAFVESNYSWSEASREYLRLMSNLRCEGSRCLKTIGAERVPE